MFNTDRTNYYIISLFVGIIYFFFYAIIYSLLITTSFLYILQWGYLIADCLLVILFLIKDFLDERRIRMSKSSVGPSWLEHSPLAFMIFLHLIVTALLDPVFILAVLKIIFSIVAMIDIIWDLSQDIRSKSR